QRPQCEQRLVRIRVGREAAGIGPRTPIDLRLAVATAPDQVGLEADDRVTAARLAALNALKQEGVVAPLAKLEEGGNRSLEVRDQPCAKNLRHTGVVTPREGRK